MQAALDFGQGASWTLELKHMREDMHADHAMSADVEAMTQRAPILAVVYSDGIEADKLLSDIGYELRDGGTRVAGLVQQNKFVRHRTKCDMELEELLSGAVFMLSEDRGSGATGCRLDAAVLTAATALLANALDSNPAIVIVNKFGKVEVEGGGVRDAVATAAQMGLPVIVGVPHRNLSAWRGFAGDLAEECAVDPVQIRLWLDEKLCERQASA